MVAQSRQNFLHRRDAVKRFLVIVAMVVLAGMVIALFDEQIAESFPYGLGDSPSFLI